MDDGDMPLRLCRELENRDSGIGARVRQRQERGLWVVCRGTDRIKGGTTKGANSAEETHRTESEDSRRYDAGEWQHQPREGRAMEGIIKIVVGLSIVAFLLAVIGVLFVGSDIAGVPPEGYSRACTNLALIALAMNFCCRSREHHDG